MPAKKIQTTGKADDHRTADYLQIFLYRVPKANRGAFASVQGKLAELFHRHGMVRSDFFVLRDARIFGGFRDLRSVLGATPDEEVWVEIETYRDAADSVRVIGDIGKDPEADSLFAQVIQLAAPGVLCPQGNAERVHF